jgi:RNA polymerase sigma factor (sigma-70 family)
MELRGSELHRLVSLARHADAALPERHAAFGDLVARFQDLAFGCAYAVLRDFYLAEDAAQQAFFAAWQKLTQLREPEAFPGWLRRLVLTECNRLTRGQRLRFVPMDEGLDVKTNALDPHASCERDELRAQVHTALTALPPGERMVTTLFYIGEYSQAEISAFLDLPVTTVVKRLYTARQRLKKTLQRLEMIPDELQTYRPSRNAAFAEQVSARLRPFAADDWASIPRFVYGLAPDYRADEEMWLRNRQQFNEARFTRRQYVVEHAETRQLIGYGSIEQTIFLPQYRLFLFAAPEWLRAGVGDLLLDRLLDDLRAANAIAVWHRGFSPGAQLTEVFDLLAKRGFAETRRLLDCRLHLADFDSAAFQAVRKAVFARGITITTYAEESARDADCLRKLHDFLNTVKADDPARQPYVAAPYEAAVRWCASNAFLPDAAFIAKDGDRYVGFTDLIRYELLPHGIAPGFTGVAPTHRRQGIATALKLCALEYALAHSYQVIRVFMYPSQTGMRALNEKLGFRRHYEYVTVEKLLREVASINPELYDAYVGRYAPAPETLRQHNLPADMTATIRKINDRLFAETRDAVDELFPSSATEFFTDHHYGQFAFVRNEAGRVTHLRYCEGELEALAHKLD